MMKEAEKRTMVLTAGQQGHQAGRPLPMPPTRCLEAMGVTGRPCQAGVRGEAAPRPCADSACRCVPLLSLRSPSDKA